MSWQSTRGEATRNGGNCKTTPSAEDANGHVSRKGYPGNEDSQQPDFCGVQNLPGIDRTVREDGQSQKRHGEQHQHAARLDPGHGSHPRMQRVAQGQEDRHGDRRGNCDGLAAQGGISAQDKGQCPGNDAGHAEVLLVPGLEIGEASEAAGVGEESGGENQGRRRARHQCSDAAKQPGQCEGPQTGGPLTVGVLAGLPAALETDEQADRQRDSQPPKKLDFTHVPTADCIRVAPSSPLPASSGNARGYMGRSASVCRSS